MSYIAENYYDAKYDARYVNTTGGDTMVGPLSVSSGHLQLTAGAEGQGLYWSGLNRFLYIGSGRYRMADGSGTLVCTQIGSPIDGESAARVDWVGASYFPIGGGTFSGSVAVNGTFTAGTANLVVGPQYSGFTNGGAYGANRFAMGWKSGNIYGGVDNANNAVLGTPSARKWKTNIIDLTDSLGKIKSLRPVEYTPKDVDGTPVKGVRQPGLIADEVQLSVPSVVVGEGTDISVNYPLIVPLLIGAVQELVKRIEVLEGAVNGTT